jgi:ketosteroid isomerase-like protein
MPPAATAWIGPHTTARWTPPTGGPASAVKRVTADVVVSVHTQIRGQGLVGGGAIPLRDNRSLHVLARQPDGGWKIVSEMYTDVTYAHHS